MTQRADCSLIHHTGSPVPLGFPLSCPSHLALRQHCLVLASMAMCASFTRILMSFYLSFAYTFLCALCTYLFRLYSPSPPSPRIQSSMSLTLPNKALVGTSMYIRSTLQLIAERPHQNLIPCLRSRNVLRVPCSYLLFSRRHHIKPDLDAVELSSTHNRRPFLSSPYPISTLRNLYPRGSRAQTAGVSHTSIPFPCSPTFPFISFLLPLAIYTC